jgi:phage nucleotide-binding protein
MKQSSDNDIASRIKPVSEIGAGLAALIYGNPGTGKTELSSTFPKPLLLLDILQNGTDTIAKKPGIDVLRIKQWEDTEEVYWYLTKGKGRNKYKSVIIDQITEAQDVCMSYVRSEGGKDSDDTISKRMWGEISGEMKTFILNYRDLINRNMNVAFLAHERVSDGDDAIEDQIEPTIGPRMMPSVADFLCGAVAVIGNTFIRERFKTKDGKRQRFVDYAMRIGPHAYYRTKVRHPVGVDTPDVVVNPTFDEIMAIVKGRKILKAKKVK